jgi:hypothetical protein
MLRRLNCDVEPDSRHVRARGEGSGSSSSDDSGDMAHTAQWPTTVLFSNTPTIRLSDHVLTSFTNVYHLTTPPHDT